MILYWILGVLTFMGGYGLGYLHGMPFRYDVQQAKKLVGTALNLPKQLKHRKAGIIERPTQADIIRKENPKLAEEEDAMREVFDQMGAKQ